MKDADLLLKWRNNEETRKASKDTAIIKRKEHIVWLETVLNNNQRGIYIAEQDGVAVGTVRFDPCDEGYELSWTVAPKQRGRGIGKRMVADFANSLTGQVIARIRENNTASIHIAEHAGMTYDLKKGPFLYFKREALKA